MESNLMRSRILSEQLLSCVMKLEGKSAIEINANDSPSCGRAIVYFPLFTLKDLPEPLLFEKRKRTKTFKSPL